MITYKFQFNSDKEFYDLLKEGNKITRIAYNIYKKGFDVTLKQCIGLIKKDYNYNKDLIDASMIESFCQDALALYKSCDERNQKKLTFGSKKKWKEFIKGNLTKEEWFNIRDTRALFFMGKSADRFGNRKFQLDTENNKVIFKHKRKNHYNLNLIGLNKRYNNLLKIQMLAEQHLCPITYRVDDKHIYISFDEKFLKTSEHTFVKDRVAGLDLNPNFIAFTVIDNGSTVVHKEIIDLTDLNKTRDTNKIHYEVIQASKRLSNLCKHYKVEIVGYEDLNIKSKDKGKGRNYNRTCNNDWRKNLFLNNFKKRLNILGINNQKIAPAYSSTIGQINNPLETDSIGAALEISRRVYVYKKRFIDKDKNFIDKEIIYPKMDFEKVKENWKSILSEYNPTRFGWKSLHNYLYKSQKKPIEFRFLFKDYDFSSWSSFRIKSIKNPTVVYTV
jgi:hypothetical protein